ncbi:hypothetical protein PVAND_017235 [Polypedilum vanderplanki]|uniref:BTB domain-containing protein n=1 Tax=Polypedilum vanderplanki TaxID=319348 RepID=A0A9J6BIH4_POLVA|nr:hypothetical protein PVAND_017235 [Polypedilum vanderplanki]
MSHNLEFNSSPVFFFGAKSIQNLPKLSNITKCDCLQKIFADAAFKDFTINVGESSFKIHKVLFAAKSQTLSEIFKNNPEVQELNLNDISEVAFKAMYDFIYGEELAKDANHIEVFAAAARFKIDDLKENAGKFLLDNINENNAYNVLVLSNKFNHEELRKKAFKVIQDKIFLDRKLNENLAKEHQKLKELIDVKKLFEQKFADFNLN